MSNPNERQVGGEHYKRHTYQHWDLAVNVQMNYLEGYSTKYLARWREKGGPEDLEKVVHIIQKLRSVSDKVPRTSNLSIGTILIEVSKYALANNLPTPETLITRYLACWDTDEDLRIAEETAVELLEQAKREFSAKPVPLTEENHHAERFQYDDRT